MADLAPRQVGKSSLMCCPLGFGGGPLGDPRISVQDSYRTVVAAWESGARHFDTAPWYGVGRSERRLGMALNSLAPLEQHVARESYTINSKVGRVLVPEPTRDNSKKTRNPVGGVRTPRDPLSGFRVSFDYTREGILKSYDESLHRMGTSYIDSLTIHDLDYGHANQAEIELGLQQLSTGGGAAALMELRNSGVVKAIGMGNNMTCDVDPRQPQCEGNILSWEGSPNSDHEKLCQRVADIVDLDFMVMAGPYTLLEQRATKALLPLCEERTIGMVIATPYCGGILALGPKPGVRYMYAEPPPWIAEKAQRMFNICERHGVELAAAAIQFPLAHKLTAGVIPGAASAEEALANARHIKTPVPDDVWRLFREEGFIENGLPTPSSNQQPRSSL